MGINTSRRKNIPYLQKKLYFTEDKQYFVMYCQGYDNIKHEIRPIPSFQKPGDTCEYFASEVFT